MIADSSKIKNMFAGFTWFGGCLLYPDYRLSLDFFSKGNVRIVLLTLLGNDMQIIRDLIEITTGENEQFISLGKCYEKDDYIHSSSYFGICTGTLAENNVRCIKCWKIDTVKAVIAEYPADNVIYDFLN